MSRILFPLLFCLIILFSCNTNSSSGKTNISESKTTSPETNNVEDENLSGTQGIFSYAEKGQHIVARNYVLMAVSICHLEKIKIIFF